MIDATHPDLQALARLSAMVGRDVTLVQGAGGNSSVKLDDVLWVKASGTWLAEAGDRPIFVPVALAVARRAIAEDRENIPALDGANAMRPSIETSLHALLPHRIVLHVHGVNTIAWSVLTGREAGIAERLTGLRWSLVPYHRPGVPLSRAVARIVERDRPDVLILGNHGLVVGGDDTEAVEQLVREVEWRLDLPPREGASADLQRLERLSAGTSYRPAGFPDCHLAALDPQNIAVATGGSLYPDHVVFLGPAAYALAEDETPAEVVERTKRGRVAAPACLLAPDVGVLIRSDLSPGAEAMLRCLGLVTSRIPSGAAVRYLSEDDEDALLNWDAERYRQSLARA